VHEKWETALRENRLLEVMSIDHGGSMEVKRPSGAVRLINPSAVVSVIVFPDFDLQRAVG
jgi:hypothetical protein